MIVIEQTVISDDIIDEFFLCDLDKCKGACCVEGDLGAPLSEEEMEIIPKIYSEIKPFLTETGKKAIKKEGYFLKDWEGDFSTPTINGKECAYAIYNDDGILECGIEKAFDEGKTDFKKPISCHLYPIRLTKYDHYIAVNYDRWPICSSACSFGKKKNLPLYKFLKEALVRRFGQKWYDKLEAYAIEKAKQNFKK